MDVVLVIDLGKNVCSSSGSTRLLWFCAVAFRRVANVVGGAHDGRGFLTIELDRQCIGEANERAVDAPWRRVGEVLKTNAPRLSPMQHIVSPNL